MNYMDCFYLYFRQHKTRVNNTDLRTFSKRFLFVDIKQKILYPIKCIGIIVSSLITNIIKCHGLKTNAIIFLPYDIVALFDGKAQIPSLCTSILIV